MDIAVGAEVRSGVGVEGAETVTTTDTLEPVASKISTPADPVDRPDRLRVPPETVAVTTAGLLLVAVYGSVPPATAKRAATPPFATVKALGAVV